MPLSEEGGPTTTVDAQQGEAEPQRPSPMPDDGAPVDEILIDEISIDGMCGVY